MPRVQADGAKIEATSKVKQEALPAIIDLELDDDDPNEAARILQAKAEIKAEIKQEKANLYDKRKEKKSKKDGKDSKVKKEKKDDDDKDRSRSRQKASKAKDKKDKKEGKEKKESKDGKRRSRSGSRRREKKRSKSRSRSGSKSSSGSSSSELDPYVKFKPYTKVTLVNLVRKAELNGKGGQVVHPSCAVSPCPPGCLLVRLDTGREIAVRPANLRAMKAFHMTPQQSTLSQEERLQQVLLTIRSNVDSVVDRGGGGSGMVLTEGGDFGQGGMGAMI